jgi:hypothetical protein
MISYLNSQTCIKRFIDGQIDFYRGWSEYEVGFGDLTKEFWLGMYEVLPGVLEQSRSLRQI